MFRRDGEVVRLEPEVLDLLAHLVRNHGRVVTKEELLDEVWGTRFVSEASLTSRIHAARQAVGDDGSKQAVIRTVRNRGYEFVAPVTEHAVAPEESESGAGEADTEAQPEELTTESSLPTALLDLIGRDELLVELQEALDGHRLVTLIGPGGVGKTAIAYELARSLEARYADGVSTVQFVTVNDAEATVESLASALDVQRRRDTSLEDAVVNVLRPRHTLLLLDNCEHVIEPLAAVVERIMQEAPDVSVLATSRQPLALPGERLWPIEPLGVEALDPQAPLAELRSAPVLRLFVDRATAADPRFVLDESTVGPTIGICQRLDGMPLALELAAARVRTIGVEEIEERLNERFRLLRTVRRGGDPRHQTLHGAVQWSYDLLDTDEQQLFDELSIFADQFDIAAVAAVCGDRDELDALDLVTALAERSMLGVRAQASGAARYEMLETLRDYGRANLDEPAYELLGKQHMSYYLGLSREVEIGQRGPSEAAANARAEAAFADLRAAQRFASEHEDVDDALGLVSALGEYGMRSMRYEALTWADAALGCSGIRSTRRPGGCPRRVRAG